MQFAWCGVHLKGQRLFPPKLDNKEVAFLIKFSESRISLQNSTYQEQKIQIEFIENSYKTGLFKRLWSCFVSRGLNAHD